MDRTVGVAGCGKLGLAMAALYSSKGVQVVAYDKDPEVVSRLPNKRGMPCNISSETGVNELLLNNPIHPTNDCAMMARMSEVVFVVVPTPSRQGGEFDSSFVCDVASKVGDEWARDGSYEYPILVVCSTVMPGSCNSEIKEALESGGLCVGESCGLAYSPEFVALGSVLHDMVNPDMVLIGSDHSQTSARIEEIYRTLTPGSVIHHLSVIDAEIAKLSINFFLSLKVGFANNLARVCERVPGADASKICVAIGSDSRIGNKFLRPGDAAGGPCLPRDVLAMRSIDWRIEDLCDAAMQSSTMLKGWIYSKIRSAEALGDSFSLDVAVLGLSYKIDTPVTDSSTGVEVAQQLASWGSRVAVHDPAAPIPEGLAAIEDLRWIAEAQIVLVVTPWDDYRGISPNAGQTVIDLWGICEEGEGTLVRPGVGP